MGTTNAMASGSVASRREFLAMIGAAGALVACGNDGGGAGSSGGGDADEDDTGATAAPSPERTVLALGEEYLLADLLALGVRPVASTANVVLNDGFAGLDGFDTTGIEAMPSLEPNLEQLASYGADIVVASTFVFDNVGREVLEGLGDELVVVPDDDPDGRLLLLGDTFGARDEAEDLIAGLETAIEDARSTLSADGVVLSVATVYPGPTVAAWVDGPTEVPAMLLAIGFTLRPGSDDVSGDEIGRVYLSDEQIGILDAETLVTVQSDLVEGEPEAVDAIAESRLWSTLPAVAAGRVVAVDRLGYPGVAGRRRLVDDLVELLAAD